MPEHNLITDPNIHEPKGASTASSGTVYVSDGAGSGTWEKVSSTSLDIPSVADALAASSLVSVTVTGSSPVLLPLPAGSLSSVTAVNRGDITGNTTLSLSRDGGGSLGSLSYPDETDEETVLAQSVSSTFSLPGFIKVTLTGDTSNVFTLTFNYKAT